MVQPHPPAAANAHARYALALMACVTVLNVMDRQLLAVLIEPIKAELRLSDTQMGVLTGLAFAAFHALATLPIAAWADRGVRRTIIALGLALWSGLTLLTGLARSYPEILLARLGIGVGEATGAAPAQSLLSDYFPAERRSTALAVLVMGGPLGSMVAYAGGGWIGEVLGWRAAFVLFGAPGLLLALLIRLTLREPRRGQTERAPASDLGPLPVLSALRLLARSAVLRRLMLASALNAWGNYAVLIWSVAFLMRAHDMGTAEAGAYLALGCAAANAVGVFLGGRLCDGLAARDARWQLWVPALTSALTAPLGWAFLFAPERGAALALLVPTALLNMAHSGPLFAAIQGLVRPQLRASAAAGATLANTILGLGLGATLVGVLNDALAPRLGEQAIRTSLALALAPHLAAALLLMGAAPALRGGMHAARLAQELPR
jgi:predicted MFS family arabinose efflux permease